MTMHIQVDVAAQQLLLRRADAMVRQYPVSTAYNGLGQLSGSECTPTGRHVIRAMIGHDCPSGTVFVARRATGEIYSEQLASQYPERDWILTRILWLSGLERGKNRLGDVDSFRRYIYIHGTPDSEPMGIPLSHGCIRMRNADVIDLFSRVSPGTPVEIG